MYQNKYSLCLLRGLLQSSIGCRMPLVRYSRAAGVKGRNPAKIGLEGPRLSEHLPVLKLDWTSSWSHWGCGDMNSRVSSCCASASLLGQGFFSSIQPGSLAVTHTFNFLSWMWVAMSYFFPQQIFPYFEESCPQSLPEGALCFLQPCAGLTFVAFAPAPLLRGSLGDQCHQGALSLCSVST